jgi:selenide,water dikinase
MQGPELNAGFVVNGQAMRPEQGLLPKSGAQPGDQLILTKALGTGTLFAAHMQQLADGRDIAAAIESMLRSSVTAAELALAHEARACTDITGFGLAGHLLEMLAVGQGASLQLAALPLLPGALEQVSAGVLSSGHAANATAARDVIACEAAFDATIDASKLEMLFDPQTSGGLLIAVPPGRSTGLCEALHQSGSAEAAVIGEVLATDHGTDGPRLFCR